MQISDKCTSDSDQTAIIILFNRASVNLLKYGCYGHKKSPVMPGFSISEMLIKHLTITLLGLQAVV